jgi:hypothetical protein
MSLGRRTPEDDELLRQLRNRRRAPNPDTMAFVERIQADTASRPPFRPPAYYTPEAIRSVFPNATDNDVAELMRFLTELDSSIRPPTPYEGVQHGMLQANAALLDEAVARLGSRRKPVEQPLFALIAVGYVNARAMRAPNTGDPIVFVDEELLLFPYLFAEVVALAMPVVRQRADGASAFSAQAADIRTHLRQKPMTTMHFVELLLSYAMTGRASSLARLHDLPPELAGFATKLAHAAEIFVLAHEYAHVREGHLSHGLPYATGTNGEQVSQSLGSVALEGVADYFGLGLSIAVLERFNLVPGWAYWGAELFLYANEILLKAISVLRSGHEISGLRPEELRQHALFKLRREALEFMVRDRIRNSSSDQAEFEHRWAEINTVMHTIRDAMTELWAGTAPLLWISHSRGARPCSTWNS